MKLYDAKSALLFKCIFREYYEVVANSDIGETLIYFGDKPKDMQDKISDLPVFGDTIYSPELFSDSNKTVESDDTTVCDNISYTLITSDIQHGNIFAHHIPCKDDIIIISSDCESDSSFSILKKKKWKDNAFTLMFCSSNV